MILVPMLIIQIFLFPLVAIGMMNSWTDSRRTIAIQEVASHLVSSLQQLYSAINHDTISAGTITNKLDLPGYIEDFAYIAHASLRTAGSNPGGSRVLEITISYVGVGISTTAIATFGGNMEWKNSVFLSNSTSTSIIAEKVNDTIKMYFG